MVLLWELARHRRSDASLQSLICEQTRSAPNTGDVSEMILGGGNELIRFLLLFMGDHHSFLTDVARATTDSIRCED